MPPPTTTLATICAALSSGHREHAIAVLHREYPFAPVPATRRAYTPLESTRVFVRDGFIDRYSGIRLVFPAALRAISIELPVDFPYHPNWRTEDTHPAFWELSATLDHVIPVTRGGADDESNWVTTSMARNSAKSNGTLEEIGWSLHPLGDMKQWDGLLGWFVEYATAHPHVVASAYMRSWLRAAKAV
jgi:hypothetical protein